ncbi:MAG: DNA repair and recombination protein RadB [Candidatus Thermoplasmatota archaeon]|nr:DNA repair and recombination protein RadB [Candidatus Thermoplasmatota archaeon]MBU4071570.1 DNA repair and recombination protein RadB [Candidatus Thermoplasmatota archaeon]MBU4144463.1 DNA repair and recombination protein RadB [Candidatus Thermoplasmatota archaeon]MBU4592305.1 DNA repair and recombination protein RadB [Candidatus Thermoplasmatota archaeon]
MKVPTGASCIDNLLGGGFESGAITQIYGEAGSGKTNMCLVLARAIINSGKKIIYIDSEGLSRDRIQQIFGAEYDNMVKSLLIFEPFDFEEQEAIIDKAVMLAMKNDDIGLLVLDSATGHYRVELAKDLERTERRSFVAQITALLTLCRRRVIPILITSQVYTDIERNEYKALGGHVLRHNCKVIIRLDRDQDMAGRREAVLMKHRSLAEGRRAEFWLTGDGIKCGP